MPDILYRAAEGAELREASAVLVRSWKEAYRGVVPEAALSLLRDDKWLKTLERWNLAGSDKETALLLVNRKICGMAVYGMREDKDVSSRLGEVFHLYILPEFWGQGMGSTFLSHMHMRFAALGYRGAVAWVPRDVGYGRRCFAAMGYKADGAEREARYAGAVVQEARMRTLL